MPKRLMQVDVCRRMRCTQNAGCPSVEDENGAHCETGVESRRAERFTHADNLKSLSPLIKVDAVAKLLCVQHPDMPDVVVRL
jgi:hypothetical protein